MSKFETVDIDLTEEEWHTLARLYIETNCSAESVDMLDRTLEDTDDWHLAVYNAVLNEMTNDILSTAVEEQMKWVEFVDYCRTPSCLYKVK